MRNVNVRVIEDQKVETVEKEATAYDIENFYKKTGYVEEYKGIKRDGVNKNDNDLTFEEMFHKKNQEFRDAEKKKRAPKPMTFGGEYDSYSKYGEDSEMGFGFRIDVSSNMKLP